MAQQAPQFPPPPSGPAPGTPPYGYPVTAPAASAGGASSGWGAPMAVRRVPPCGAASGRWVAARGCWSAWPRRSWDPRSARRLRDRPRLVLVGLAGGGGHPADLGRPPHHDASTRHRSGGRRQRARQPGRRHRRGSGSDSGPGDDSPASQLDDLLRQFGQGDGNLGDLEDLLRQFGLDGLNGLDGIDPGSIEDLMRQFGLDEGLSTASRTATPTPAAIMRALQELMRRFGQLDPGGSSGSDGSNGNAPGGAGASTARSGRSGTA